MKPWSVILSIILLLFAVVRWSNSCTKAAKRKKGLVFRQWVTKVDRKSDELMSYRYSSSDSISWMTSNRKDMDKVLDSAIQFYKDEYFQDEDRYKIYLKILYEYKKLSYVYYDWIKSARIRENKLKQDKDFRLMTLDELQKKQRSILYGMHSYNIELIMID